MKHSVENRTKLRDDPYLTPKGERFFGRVDAAKTKTADLLEKAKIPAIAALGAVAAALVIGGAYDTVGPKKEIAETSITLGDTPPREGDISIVEKAVEGLGYNPDQVRGVVSEGQSMRDEAEGAGTDAGTITIHESPVLGYKSVDVSFKNDDSN